MRCLLIHKWGNPKAVTATSCVPYVRTVLHYRTCRRCGTMQRGIYDRFWNYMVWETMRERTYIKSQQLKIVREPSPRLDRLAHTLGLRRSRMGDRMRAERRTVQI